MPGHFTFFTQDIEQGIATFDEAETRHMVQVLRYTVGSVIEFTDGLGNYYHGNISEVQKKCVKVSIQQVKTTEKPGLTLAVGILKSTDRMEWLLEKSVELGLKSLVLLKCSNSERSKISVDKLNKTAVAALKQSHGSWLPIIEVLGFKDAVSMYEKQAFIAYCSEQLNSVTVKELQSNSAVFIGPEGDFSSEEIAWALKHGFQELSLGTRILRTETAAVAVAAAANLLG